MDNLESLKKALKEIEEFNFEPYSKEKEFEFKNKFNVLFKGTKSSGYVNLYNKSLTFHRIRSFKNSYSIKNISELWYPPENINLPGRLNSSFQRLLYASLEAKIAIIEKYPKQGDIAYILKFGLSSSEIKCMELGIDDISDEQRILPSEKDKLLFNYIVSRTRMRIPSSKPYLHLPTVMFRTSFNKANFDAFIYNSVQAELTGLNIGFKPDYIDQNFVFKKVIKVKITESKSPSEIKFICLSEANRMDSKGNLTFDDISNCKGHITKELKDFSHQ